MKNTRALLLTRTADPRTPTKYTVAADTTDDRDISPSYRRKPP